MRKEAVGSYERVSGGKIVTIDKTYLEPKTKECTIILTTNYGKFRKTRASGIYKITLCHYS